tara:strand:- start:285 stop:833 length:549 start_codon:yes stop_codon:yes gene_type:complete
MTSIDRSLRPIDIPLPEGKLFDGGVMFVRLQTLDALEQFWKAHRDRFGYACEGCGGQDRPNFLHEYDWVFGPSKLAVVRAVLRWGQSNLGCEFDEGGWWRYCNLPVNQDPGGWPIIDWDRNAPIAQVVEALHELTFDDWGDLGDNPEVESHDRDSLDEMIRYWRKEQRADAGYYGEENERRA